jgi:hypothetical protein
MKKLFALGLVVVIVAGVVLWQAGTGQAQTWTFPLTGSGSGVAASTPTPHPVPSPPASGRFFYGPANCHTNPVLPHPGGSRQQYADYIVNVVAPQHHLEAAVLLWQIQQESGFNPNAVSQAGAIGIAQFLPETAKRYGIDPHDPWQSLDAMARYDLDSLRAFWGWSGTIAELFGGNRNAYAWGLALAAYNAGGPHTGRALTWAKTLGWSNGPWMWLSAPNEFANWDVDQTRPYVMTILGCLAGGTR